MSKARVILLLGLIAVLSIALTVKAHGNNVLLWTVFGHAWHNLYDSGLSEGSK